MIFTAIMAFSIFKAVTVTAVTIGVIEGADYLIETGGEILAAEELEKEQKRAKEADAFFTTQVEIAENAEESFQDFLGPNLLKKNN